MSSAKTGVLQLAPQTGEAQCYIDLARLLVTGTRSFYNNPTFSDITLVCPDGRQLRCHQVILAASSKRLASVLKQGGFTGSKLPVQGVDSDALDTLIDSFYTGECPLTLATAASIYDAAVKLEVNGLPGAVEQFVSASLTPSNACMLLDRAMSTKTGRLAEVCLQFIRTRLADVVPTLEFSASSMDVVVQICTDVANNRHSPQLALQVALAWLRGPPSGPNRTHMLPALADQIGIPPELLQTYMRGSGGNSPGADGSGGSGNGGGGGGGGSLGAVSLLGEPPSLDSALPLSSLPLLQLLPPGQLQQLGMGGGAAGAAAAQLLLGQGKAGGTAALRSLLEDDGSGGAGGSGVGGRGGAGGGGGGGMGGVDGAAEAALAQRLGNLRRELEEGAAGGFAGALAAAAAAASNRGKRPRTEDSRRSSGWEQEPTSSLVRGLSGEQDMLSPTGVGGGGFPGSGPLGKLAPLPSAPSYPDPPPRDRRTPQVKGVCHVEGCYADLTGLRDYHLRYKICEFHLKVSSVLKDGVPQRFCQQCGRFHHLSEFDGNRRSCRTMLARHNMRRAKKMGQSGSPMAEDPGNAAASAAAAAAAAGANGAGPDLGAKLLQQLGGTAGLVAAMASLQQQQQQQQPQTAAAHQQQQQQLQQLQQQQQQGQLQQLAQLNIPDGMSLTDAVAAAMAGLQGNGASGGSGGGMLGSPTNRRLSELLDGLGRGANGSAVGVQMGSLLEALGASGSGGGGSGGGAGGSGSGEGAAAPVGDAAAADGGAAMPGGGDGGGGGGGECGGEEKRGGLQGDAVAALEAIAAATAAATVAASASGGGASSPKGDAAVRNGRLPSGGGAAAADVIVGGGDGPKADAVEDKAANGQ